MPQFNTITLPDTLTDIGMDLIFKPKKMSGIVASYADTAYSGGDWARNPQLTISSVLPSKTSRLQKVRMKVTLPEPMRDSAGAAILGTKDYESSVDIIFTIPERASGSNKEHIRGLAIALLNDEDTVSKLVLLTESMF